MSEAQQSGKDPEIVQGVKHLHTLYNDVLPSRGRVIISVLDKSLVEHLVVVPFPKSYDAAMAITFSTLTEHIHTNESAAPENASLKYRVREMCGAVEWAKIIPEIWNDVIKDGDHLRLFNKASESENRHSSVLARLVSSPGYHQEGALMLLPKTYEDTKLLAMKKLNIGQQSAKVHLFINFDVGGKHTWFWIDPDIGADWMALITEVRKQCSKVEIYVKHPKH